MNKPQKHILVIFGASGDLTKRKLIPALYDLFHQQYFPDEFAIVGVGRTAMDDTQFRDKMMENIRAFSNFKADKSCCSDDFKKHLYYTAIDTSNPDDYKTLKIYLTHLNDQLQTGGNIIFYMATPPQLYGIISDSLGKYDLQKEENKSFRRLIIEKPFGTDLDSAQALNKRIQGVWEEDQIYRIDHYLGKETVQNLLVTRFANGIFEPLWNNKYIKSVEITSAEDIGIGSRSGYYDKSGALRDMLQNHLLQLVGLTAMEPPAQINSDAIRNETVKVLQSLRPLSPEDIRQNVIRGQYTESTIKGEKVKGYQQEDGIPQGSRTATYVAMKFYIDNWRWGGVPFYIRTGKQLPTRVTEIVINFKATPHQLFKNLQDDFAHHNQLIIRIQPDEGVLMKFGMKVPGAGFTVQNVNMDFHYSELSDTYLPSSYERLLLDCMLGDSTLYARADAVEASWKFVTPILEAWENDKTIPLHGYSAGTWGPQVADNLFDPNHYWRQPCKNLVGDGQYCEL